jgi:DNA mismatch endonuclease (patch repair protein)
MPGCALTARIGESTFFRTICLHPNGFKDADSGWPRVLKRFAAVALAKLFRRHGVTGWRSSQRIFSKPDFVFRQVHLAVFVDGCFWHSCPKHKTKPKNNRAFWTKKLVGNKRRDALVTRTLRRAGWQVLRIWEHGLANKNETRLLRRMQKVLKS